MNRLPRPRPRPRPHPRPHPLPHPMSSRTHRCSSRTCCFSLRSMISCPEPLVANMLPLYHLGSSGHK